MHVAAAGDATADDVRTNGSNICNERRVRYASNVAIALHGLQRKDEMMSFVQLLPASRQRTFLRNRGYVKELIQHSHSPEKAAAIYEQSGDLQKAADLLAEAGAHTSAAQLLLRQAKLVLLWPDAAVQRAVPSSSRGPQYQSGLPCGHDAMQLLLKAAQYYAEDGTAAVAIADECAVLSGLAKGFSSLGDVQRWVEQARVTAHEGLQLVAAVEGFAYALGLLSQNVLYKGMCAKLGSSMSFDATSGMQLMGLWNGMMAVLQPVLEAVDAALRKAEYSPQQEQLLRSCEYYMCIRPASGARFRTKVAESGSMLWCMGFTQAPYSGAAAAAGPMELQAPVMLQRAVEYWRWWLCAQGQQLLGLLQKLPITTSDHAEGVRLLVEAWEVQEYLLEQLCSHDLAASAPGRVAESLKRPGVVDSHSSSGSTSACTIREAMQLILSKLQEQQQHILKQVLEALLQSTGTVLTINTIKSSSTNSSDNNIPLLLRGFLQQPKYQRLAEEVAWAVAKGRLRLGSLLPIRTAQNQLEMWREPPPPPPVHLTYDRIGQLCLLAPLLHPQWMRRAELQGLVELWGSSRGPVPWRRLLQAGDWQGQARCSELSCPPAYWRDYYPVAQYSWRLCIALR
jgi:hypothetical protein